MFKAVTFSLFIISLFVCNVIFAQADSLKVKISTKNSESKKRNLGLFSKTDTTMPYSPRRATYRSAILPGWGQATNKKYWKIPVVYAALGVTTYIFFHNVKQYNEAKNAYLNSIDGNPANDSLIPQPYYTIKDQPERIKTFRNQVRQNVDYSVLFFLLFWGLNVVDATVDAHLKTFDVSDDLSLQIRPGYSPLANTNGISIVLNIHPKPLKGLK
ncbi:MAG: DUF5683 domain-containing protein [Ferruginibacter sp.]